jgi:hypothetical protein
MARAIQICVDSLSKIKGLIIIKDIDKILNNSFIFVSFISNILNINFEILYQRNTQTSILNKIQNLANILYQKITVTKSVKCQKIL